MTIKVSVVVPVFNPGQHIDGLLASLRRQSLRADEFEAIFVDDGSTDGTRERLEALAVEVANFRVIAIPHSGWPGRPRNVGIDAARGEYVQFVDNDDELGDEALERLWNYAKANRSDVVIGREERRNRRMFAGSIFRENQPRATLGGLLGLLTPHKMFRRAFLIERDIRFLEGPRRLEDHHFVMQAYFRADVISVLADYPCYYWVARTDGGNAGSRPYDWISYYGYVRDILDVVEAHTEPGPFRDSLLAHWYRGKGLRMLSGSVVRRGEQDARVHFDALWQLAEERVPPSVDEHLTPVNRIRSALLRAGDFDRYRALDRALRGIRVDERLEYVRATDDALEMRVVATLVYASGTPLMLDRREGRDVWRPPVPLGDAVPEAALDFTGARWSVEVVARRRSTYDVIPLPGRTEPLPHHRGATPVGAVRTLRLQPDTADRGRPMRLGVWNLDVQLAGAGWRAKRLLRSVPSDAGRPASRRAVPFMSARGPARLVAIPPNGGAWRLKARRAKPAGAARPRRGRERTLHRALVRIPGARRLLAAARRLRRR